jgi:hypothetical protein
MGPWVFEQLGGKKRRLELARSAAPHGRPRQGAMATDGITIRQSERRYGGDGPPTRHIFGAMFEPYELQGRFSDIYEGAGFAKSKTEEVRAFVMDQQPVRLIWEDLISIEGFIDEFMPGRESRGEVEWKMKIRVDIDFLAGELIEPAPDVPTPADFVNQMLLAIAIAKEKALEVPPTLKGDIFDALNILVGAVNSASAGLNQIADQIDSFATALVSSLRRFRAGLGQFRTAAIKFRNTYEHLTAQLALDSQNSEDKLAFWDAQATVGRAMAQALQQAARADRAAILAERGLIAGVITAQTGDTWEKLSKRAYSGNGGRGDEIRAANEVPAGADPKPGTSYLVPR